MTIQCEDCGTHVVARRSTRRLCADCLRVRKNAITTRAYVPAQKVRTCETCAQPWESARGTGRFCPPCRKERAREQMKEYAQRPEVREQRMIRHREQGYERKHRLRKYGLTPETYQALLAQHNHQCAICKSSEELCVDHDHVTGKVRGILCRRCNRSIGQLGDTADHLRAALAYLVQAERS